MQPRADGAEKNLNFVGQENHCSAANNATDRDAKSESLKGPGDGAMWLEHHRLHSGGRVKIRTQDNGCPL